MAQESEENRKKSEEALAALTAGYRAFVTYVPLPTEVPFRDYLHIPSDAVTYEIAPRATIDPHTEAEHAITQIGNAPTVILVPGRRFDASGTRHGRGGGWYDRFLAHVPRTWLRVGFCVETGFSLEPLARQPWDQRVDIVCVATTQGLRCHDTRTGA